MPTSMKDLESRLDELTARVVALEERTPGTNPAPASDDDQVQVDMARVSRFANTRDEAIAQQAARERLAERGLVDARGALRVRPAGPQEAATPPADAGATETPERGSEDATGSGS